MEYHKIEVRNHFFSVLKALCGYTDNDEDCSDYIKNNQSVVEELAYLGVVLNSTYRI